MLDFLFVMALSIIGVVLAVLGVGMASRRRTKSGAVVKNGSGFGKGLRIAGALYRGFKRASSALDEDFLSTKQMEQLFKGRYEVEAAANDTGVAAAVLAESLIGPDKTDGLFAFHQYMQTGRLPSAYLNREKIGSISGSSSSGVSSIYSTLNHNEGRLSEEGRKYAENLGISPDSIEFYFSGDLDYKTNRGRMDKIGSKHHIGIAKHIAYADQLEAIYHELKHVELEKYHPGHTDADVHKALFDERSYDLKASKVNSPEYMIKTGQLVAQLSYLDELSRTPGTFYDEATGTNKRYASITEEFKLKSPEGKALLEDADWQKEFNSYRHSKKYSGLT